MFLIFQKDTISYPNSDIPEMCSIYLLHLNVA